MAEAGPSKPTAVTSSPSDTTPEVAPAFERWRRSLSLWTGMGLNEDEQAERAKVREEGRLDRDWARCEKWKKSIMERSPSTPPYHPASY